MKYIFLGLLSALMTIVHLGVQVDGELTDRQCTTVNKQCPGEDIWFHHVPILNGCAAFCRKNPDCLSAYLDNDMICHLRAKRCEPEELVDAPEKSMDFYRLMDDEVCPNDRPLHEAPDNIYDERNEYCEMAGMKCPGGQFYNKPWKISLSECKVKCSKIITCGTINYDVVNKLCDLVDQTCDYTQLIKDETIISHRRTLKGETCERSIDIDWCVWEGYGCRYFDRYRVHKVISASANNSEVCRIRCGLYGSCKQYLYNEQDLICYITETRDRFCYYGIEAAPSWTIGRMKEDRGCAESFEWCKFEKRRCQHNNMLRQKLSYTTLANIELCRMNCEYYPTCKQYIYKNRKSWNCWLLSGECSKPTVQDDDWTLGYIKTEGEKCKKHVEAPDNIYDERNEYCAMSGLKCRGSWGYTRPWNKSLSECKDKCSKIRICGTINYDVVNKLCDLVPQTCDYTQLIKDETFISHRRTLKGETCERSIEWCTLKKRKCEYNDMMAKVMTVESYSNVERCRISCAGHRVCRQYIYRNAVGKNCWIMLGECSKPTVQDDNWTISYKGERYPCGSIYSGIKVESTTHLL